CTVTTLPFETRKLASCPPALGVSPFPDAPAPSTDMSLPSTRPIAAPFCCARSTCADDTIRIKMESARESRQRNRGPKICGRTLVKTASCLCADFVREYIGIGLKFYNIPQWQTMRIRL